MIYKVSSKTVYNNMVKYHPKALTIEQKKNKKVLMKKVIHRLTKTCYMLSFLYEE